MLFNYILRHKPASSVVRARCVMVWIWFCSPIKISLVATVAVHMIEIFERQSIRELIIHIYGKWTVHLWTL